MDKERFSLLLLEPGEIYFEDFSCTIIINDELSPHSGRLKICSKSIVYDPREITSPIIKIPLKDCQKIGLWGDEMQRVVYNDNNILSIECSNHVEMLSGNELKPYKFKPGKEFLFLLKYAQVSNILPQICQLQRASTLPTAEQNAMIATIVHSRHARFKFDPLWLSDLTEKILIDMPIDKISPLVVNPGRVVLSAERFYFQPYNNVEPYPVLKVDLKLIKKIIPRRFLLRHVGLEIYWNQNETLSHIYISFSNTSDREQFHKCILEQPNLSLEKQDQDVMTLQWQNGVISNYDYLLYINSLGDRTFNDLTQYPVFPWIVTDYTSERIDLSNKKCYRDLSKPVGALNEERFLKLKERYNEMGSPRFLYGSHYSAPGLVLFYLVRKYPHFMLCLQNGRFDHPDRMFNSMADVFRNCMNNMSDFKELIPEFYDVEQKGSFLVNNQRINFGFRSDGNKVNDVRIPLWAKSPEHFVIKLREALESDFVSDKLNDWIDLIFGYKQRGIEAERANNLYYYLCYEGGIDLDRIKDINERHALEVQIMEFGQIPKQVFTVPHPQRRTSIPVSISLLKISFETSFNKLILHKSFVGHKGTVESIMISDDKDTVISVGKDSVLKMLSISKCRQLRSISICNMALSSCIQLPDKTLIIGCWDDNILFYDVEFGKISSTFRAHHDAVSVMVWNPKFKHLASGSWDCTVNIWKDLDDVSNRPPRLMQCLVANIDLDAQISCLAYSLDNTLLAIGTKEGELSLWETKNYALSRKLENHRAAVTSICFSLDSCKFVSCGEDGIFKVIDVKTGTILFQKQLEEKLCSLSWCNDVLLIGTDQGFIYLWNMIQATMITKILSHDGPINSIASLTDCDYIVTGGHDHKINVWKTSS